MIEKQVQNHIIVAIVANKPGVLFQISNMIRRRNFNVENISAGPINDKLVRITLMIRGEDRVAKLITENLYKLVDTLEVARLNPLDTVLRELALIKIHAPEGKSRSNLLYFTKIFRGQVVDVSSDFTTVVITGEPKKIDAFLKIKGLKIKEISRTGATALGRGSHIIKIKH